MPFKKMEIKLKGYTTLSVIKKKVKSVLDEVVDGSSDPEFELTIGYRDGVRFHTDLEDEGGDLFIPVLREDGSIERRDEGFFRTISEFLGPYGVKFTIIYESELDEAQYLINKSRRLRDKIYGKWKQ